MCILVWRPNTVYLILLKNLHHNALSHLISQLALGTFFIWLMSAKITDSSLHAYGNYSGPVHQKSCSFACTASAFYTEQSVQILNRSILHWLKIYLFYLCTWTRFIYKCTMFLNTESFILTSKEYVLTLSTLYWNDWRMPAVGKTVTFQKYDIQLK